MKPTADSLEATQDIAPPPVPDLSIVDRFCDALWLEDGLARNSIDAYRRDLSMFAEWLHGTRERALLAADDGDLNAYFAARHPDSRASSANRPLAVVRRFHRWALPQPLV